MKKLYLLITVLVWVVWSFTVYSQEAELTEPTEPKPYGVEETGKYIVNALNNRGNIAAGGAYIITRYYNLKEGGEYTLSVKGNSKATSGVSMVAAWYSTEEASKGTYIGPAVKAAGNNPMLCRNSDGTHTLTVPQGAKMLVVARYNAATTILYDGEKIVHIRIPGLVKHDPAAYISGTLPVMYITTEDSVPITTKEYYLNGTYYLDNMGLDGFESIGSAEEQLPLQIKGRGNASWKMDKKPYRIKLDKKQALMGLKKNKHFCLMAHYEDANAYQRDEIGFTLSSLMGLEWTPQQRPIELVVNGDYLGIYWVAEKIRVEKDRVNVVEQKDEETDPELITGGWLIEIDNYAEDGQVVIKEGNGTNIRFTPHTPEVLSPEQRDYLTGMVTNINQLIYVEDKSDTRWEQYVDIDELAKFYVLMEIVDNCESFSGSCFWHKEKGEDTKLVVGPVWDFGSTASHWRADSFNYFIYQETQSYVTSHWIEEIAKFPRFQQKVREVWRETYPAKVEETHQHCLDYVDYITPAVKSDYKRWNWDKSSDIPYRKVRVWQMLAAKWKFLERMWKDDVMTGTADMLAADADVVSVRYFDLSGHELRQMPEQGFAVEVTTYSNGQMKSRKVVR